MHENKITCLAFVNIFFKMLFFENLNESLKFKKDPVFKFYVCKRSAKFSIMSLI